VRVNTESATRTIGEIPTEEIAKAVAILLKEGGTMTRDDLVLETSRLIGYQRRGKRIEERVQGAIELLEDRGAVSQTSSGNQTHHSDANIDAELLSRIY